MNLNFTKYIIIGIICFFILSCCFIQYETFETSDQHHSRLASALNGKFEFVNPSHSSATHTVTACTLEDSSKGLQDKQCNNIRVQNELDRNKKQGEQSGKTAAAIQDAVNSVQTVNPAQESQNAAAVSSQLTQLNEKVTVLQQDVTQITKSDDVST